MSYDDRMLVVENEPVRAGRVGLLLTQPIRGTYLPLRALSHAADCALYGLNAWGHHLTNLLLHAANCALVLLVLRACGMPALAALGGAALFAVHAVHTEAVTWVAGRRDVLFAFFFLAGVLAYVRSRRGPAFAAFALACLSKGMAVAFLPTIVAYDWTRNIPQRKGWRAYAIGLAPFAGLALGMTALHAHMGHEAGAIRGYHGGSFASAMHATVGVLGSYVRLLLVPRGLCANDYFAPSWRPGLPAVAAGAALLAGGVAFALLRRRGGLWFWWFMANLLTVLSLVPTSTLQAERYLYVPSVAFAALLGWAVWRTRPRKLAATVLCSMLLAHAALACQRNFDWRNSAALWRSVLEANPGNPKALGELALIAQYEYGQTARAERLYLESLEANPKLPRTHLNLAALYAAQGKDALAEPQLRTAIELKPDFAKAHASLAALLLRAGKLDEAALHARRAAAIAPDLAGAQDVLRAIEAARKGGRP